MRIRRRDNPPRFTDYRRYKSVLREDFLFCCSYCGMHESLFGALRNMTIDHYRPKSRFPQLVNVYGNLHYCCGECNTHKGDCWPDDQQLAQDFRFLDACADDVFEHIRFEAAVAVPQTNPARYTITHLRLNRPELRSRRNELAKRFSELVAQLDRLARLRAKVVGARRVPDPALELEFDALQGSIFVAIRELIFPRPLGANLNSN